MDRNEAMTLLSEIKHYMTAGNPVWHKEVVAEALDIAIEALQNLSKPNNGLQGSDLISRTDAIRWVKTECNPYGKPTLDFESGKKVIEHLEQMPSADEQDDNRLYIKIYANDEPSRKAEKLYQICGETESQEVAQWLKEYFPSVDRPTTDCTEFMEWLKAEVLDEDNWELNAVAYGEIICRKLKKLGWIDVEDGFYVDTRPTGEWEEVEDYNGDIHYQCNQCKNEFILIDGTPQDNDYKYCPNCGARMLGEDGEA